MFDAAGPDRPFRSERRQADLRSVDHGREVLVCALRSSRVVFAWMCLMIVGYLSAAIAITVATTMVVFAHEVLHARQAREDFMLQPPA
jgi:hypothetical protein